MTTFTAVTLARLFGWPGRAQVVACREEPTAVQRGYFVTLTSPLNVWNFSVLVPELPDSEPLVRCLPIDVIL